MLESCAPAKKVIIPPPSFVSLRFIGEYIIPYNLSYNNTTVGGLSGIDYDRESDEYYFISDDRSDINPARYYKARIFFNNNSIDSVRFIDVKYLFNGKNSYYSPHKTYPYVSTDPEAIRYNPIKHEVIWSSEGERMINSKDTVLQNPSVNIIAANGKRDSFTLPANLRMHTYDSGPRRNSTIESLSYSVNFGSLFIGIEEPLYEDGPRAISEDNNAFVRIYKFDTGKKNNTAQYAYKLDPVAHPSIPSSGYKINGMTDMLCIDSNRFFIVERSFSTGRFSCTIKFFICNIENATNIMNIPSLKETINFSPVTKKLLLNMDQLKIYIDNIEGVTFGPELPNGHKTLLFIADNNFMPLQRSQLLLFELVE